VGREIIFMRAKRLGIAIIATVGLMVCISGHAAKDDDAAASDEKKFHELDEYDQKLRRLDYYQKRYPEEIFEFCTQWHGLLSSKLKGCMRRQVKFKISILSEAQNQLGTRSLAQSVYDDCLDYYPVSGVAIISACVRTRLKLSDKLKDEPIEKVIYQNCNSKWRKHGFTAVNNCCIHEGNYYSENGQLRDWHSSF